MAEPIANCPSCNGRAEIYEDSCRSGYGEYERSVTNIYGRCIVCGVSGKKHYRKTLAEFTSHTVIEFRENPALRARVEEEYIAYIEQQIMDMKNIMPSFSTLAAIKSQYGLCDSELKLAGNLATGYALYEVCEIMNLTECSAHTYLKRIYDKMDVHAQSVLVARVWQMQIKLQEA